MDTSQKFTDGMADYQKAEFWKLQNENKELKQRLFDIEWQNLINNGYKPTNGDVILKTLKDKV